MELYKSTMYWPSRVVAPFSWAGHLHFANWLVHRIKPKSIVELGTHTGNSFFAFCDGVKNSEIKCTCTAVDTWKGDAHSNFYDESVYESVKAHVVQAGLSDIVNLKRMTFDDALSDVPDHSVDILHIDGFHTYDAVKHDYTTWRPKIRHGGIVLFHDTSIQREGFGVDQFWQELLHQGHDRFNFTHSCGLGVLITQNLGEDLIGLRERLDLTAEEYANLPKFFGAISDRVLGHVQIAQLKQRLAQVKK